MLALRGYAVMQAWPKEDSKPFCLVRIHVDSDQQVEHTVIGDHDSRNIALYWATRLNEGTISEEEAAKGLKEGIIG